MLENTWRIEAILLVKTGVITDGDGLLKYYDVISDW